MTACSLTMWAEVLDWPLLYVASSRKERPPNASLSDSLPDHVLVSLDHLTDDPGGNLGIVLEVPDNRLGVVPGHDHHQADAHVEYVIHLGFRHRPECLQPGKDRRNGP